MLIVIFPLVTTLLTFAGPAQRCLSYEPNKVTLNGRIKREIFAGPPNYESIAKGDKSEAIWVLHLAKPICLKARGDWKEEKNVADVQLVFPEGERQYTRHKLLVGRKVVIVGSLFHAHTGHHHTKVLLTVTGLRRKTEYETTSRPRGSMNDCP